MSGSPQKRAPAILVRGRCRVKEEITKIGINQDLARLFADRDIEGMRELGCTLHESYMGAKTDAAFSTACTGESSHVKGSSPGMIQGPIAARHHGNPLSGSYSRGHG